MNTQKMQLAGLVLAMGLSGTAQAALESRLDGLAVYDTDLNITWLADANLAATSTFGISGINPYGFMDWNTTQSWIGAMNAANYLGYNDWRLSTVTDTGTPGCNVAFIGTDCGYNVDTTTSEMAHMYFDELHNPSAYDTAGNPNTSFESMFFLNTAPFNLPGNTYWSGTEYALNPTDYVWVFNMGIGNQSTGYKGSPYSLAWAVRSGDVALTCTDPTCTAGPITSVPEPEAFGLILSGLGLVGWAARRRGETKSK